MGSFCKNAFLWVGGNFDIREIFDERVEFRKGDGAHDWRTRRSPEHAGRVCSQNYFARPIQCLCVKHPGIVAEKREEFAFATTAIFLRFPKEKPEKPIFVKNSFGQRKTNLQGTH